MRHAKIVCTLGPATTGYENIRQLIVEGMDVARLNFSHGDHEQHRRAYEDVRRASLELKKPVAIMADLCGPKIRLGEIEGGEVEIRAGEPIVFTTRQEMGTAEVVSTSYVNLPSNVEQGSSIFVDDGLLEFVVQSVTDDEVHCQIKTSGVLKSRKGMNIPHASPSTPAMTEKDKEDMAFAKGLGVDYFALSFVRRASDVLTAKAFAGDVPVIAKIEKPAAVEQLEAIADCADGLMVARGDLAIEAGAEKVPMLQKRMIREMNRRAKPVITATQMLESMCQHPIPTRAEVSDVANAVLDGTDAVMLSAESAAGKYPFLAVRAMARIIAEVESTAHSDGILAPPTQVATPSFNNAIAHSAARAALELGLSAVAVYSETGRSVALVSAYRPQTAIVAFTRCEQVLPRLALHWGVVPIPGVWSQESDEAVRQAEKAILEHGLAKPGDEIAVTFGKDDGLAAGTTIMRLWKIGTGSTGS